MGLEAKRRQLEADLDQARISGRRGHGRREMAALSAELVATGEEISALRATM
jgi:hypothetical protein